MAPVPTLVEAHAREKSALTGDLRANSGVIQLGQWGHLCGSLEKDGLEPDAMPHSAQDRQKALCLK
jgi:hypothetical protein